jgi:hypothetical protein
MCSLIRMWHGVIIHIKCTGSGNLICYLEKGRGVVGIVVYRLPHPFRDGSATRPSNVNNVRQ